MAEYAWKAVLKDYGTTGGTTHYVTIDDGARTIAYVLAFHHGREIEEHEDHARLMSAAPDMLEALELILPLAKGYAPDGQSDQAKKTCRSWIEAAEMAIAKATGDIGERER